MWLRDRLNRLETLTDERWDTWNRQRHDHHEVHAQEAQRIQEARQELERRLDALNELRREVVMDRGLLVRREFLDATLEALEKAQEVKRAADQLIIDKMGADIAAIQRLNANMQGRFWALGVGMSIVVILVNVLVRFL